MKRVFAVCSMLALSAALCAVMSCGGKKTAAPDSASAAQGGGSGLTLDAAIAAAAGQIDNKVDAGQKIAIVNFTSPSDAFSAYVIDELTANLVESGKLAVIDRNEIDRIREEMQFQISGEVDDESVQELGRLLGAQFIVSGSYTSLGDMHRIVIRALTVQTAAITVQYRGNIDNDKVITALLASGKSAGTSSSNQTPDRARHKRADGGASKPAEQEVQYKVGDTGPAGGIVFYDKGNNKGGWRYLEAAPEETDKAAVMLPTSNIERITNSLTDRRFGAGKYNTQMLMDFFEQNGGGINTAVWQAHHLEINGFNDWYLPSIDELQMMYNNIYANNRSGGFRPVKYWSSSYPGGTPCINFANGKEETMWVSDNNARVRAIRQF